MMVQWMIISDPSGTEMEKIRGNRRSLQFFFCPFYKVKTNREHDPKEPPDRKNLSFPQDAIFYYINQKISFGLCNDITSLI